MDFDPKLAKNRPVQVRKLRSREIQRRIVVLVLGLVPSLINYQGPNNRCLRSLISGTSEKQAPRGMRYRQVT